MYKRQALGNVNIHGMITGSGGMSIAKPMNIPFVQEVISVSTALQYFEPKTDVAIELGGEDAKIIYFSQGNIEPVSYTHLSMRRSRFSGI